MDLDEEVVSAYGQTMRLTLVSNTPSDHGQIAERRGEERFREN